MICSSATSSAPLSSGQLAAALHGIVSLNATQERRLRLNGRQVLVELEELYWGVLDDIALREKQALETLAARLDRDRGARPLASVLRTFAVDYLRAATPVSESGGRRDG